MGQIAIPVSGGGTASQTIVFNCTQGQGSVDRNYLKIDVTNFEYVDISVSGSTSTAVMQLIGSSTKTISAGENISTNGYTKLKCFNSVYESYTTFSITLHN